LSSSDNPKRVRDWYKKRSNNVLSSGQTQSHHKTHPLKHFIDMFLLFGRGQVDEVGEADISAGCEEFVSDLAGCFWAIIKVGNFGLGC
jgi:hypothetical protein